MDSDVRFDDDMTEEDRVFGRTDYEMGFRTDLDAAEEVPETEVKGKRIRKGRFGRKTEEEIVDRARPEEDPYYRPEVAPKSALGDALSLLQQGTEKYGYDALPGSADAEDRLTRATQGGVDLDRERFTSFWLSDFQNAILRCVSTISSVLPLLRILPVLATQSTVLVLWLMKLSAES